MQIELEQARLYCISQITALQQHWSQLYLGKCKDHKTPNDLQTPREEEGPSPGTEGISMLANSISQVRHNNLSDSTTCDSLYISDSKTLTRLRTGANA